MAASEITKPQDDDATRGLTLRELVLEVRTDLKGLSKAFDGHLREHAESDGVTRGEARVFGFARSSIAIAVAVISAFTAVWSLVH